MHLFVHKFSTFKSVIHRRTILFLILLLVSITGYSQYTGNSRIRIVALKADTLQLDTLSIIPGSVSIKTARGEVLDTSLYKIKYGEGKIIVNRKNLPPSVNPDSLQFSYKTFPYLFSSETRHKDVNRIRADIKGRNDPFSYTLENKSDDLFKMDGLNKSGSISRGISFGNNQDVVVNSNLNLQLSGHLTNNIDILLAATDNNIPIQPEGNTQQLQEFDKVFIQFSNPTTKLIAGDFQLMRPSGYFMNFYKKSQGLSFTTVKKVVPDVKDSTKSGLYRTSLNVAVSRGKFARNQIQGIESNQGPYRLIGAERELFIIVLSGTEKVYIDGRLLTRGQENDYIIDYNSAEITFTAKQLITKDKRIVIEFQYSDKNYARSLMHFSNDYEQGRLKAHFHVYSEQDSKNQPLQQDLTNDQKALLYEIGDTLTKAVSPSIDSIGWSSTEVLYRKTDTIIGTKINVPVYVYSIDSTKAKYRLTFSNVGQGNGNYKQISASANGKVFQWVMPDTITGVLNGNFEPVVQLITPKKKQMVTAGIDYAFRKTTSLSVEAAVSNNDLNTFSSADDNDNVGYGFKLNFNDASPLTKTPFNEKDTSHTPIVFLSNVNYEFVQRNFSPIERYRSIEFERDWNRATVLTLSDQHIVGAGVGLSKKKLGVIGYRFNAFFEGNNYNANKHFANLNIVKKKTSIFYDGSLLSSKSTSNTTFYRHKSSITQKIKFLSVGLKDEFEQNKFSLSPSTKDSLLSNSYRFWEWQAFAQNADTTKNKYGLNYKQRTDFAINRNINTTAFRRSAFAESYGGFFEWLQNPNSQLKVNAAYRRLQIVDSLLTLQKPDNSLVARIEYNLRALKGFIYSNTYYEIGSGLEVKKQFSFIKVPTGQGVYIYGGDYNSNGVQDLNEFEVARFANTADYIKVYTPTNEYIRTYSNQFSQTFMIRPSSIWAQKKGIRKALSLFANQASYRVERKSTETDFAKAYNPFLNQANSNTLAALTSSFRNTLFINQLNPVFSVDLNYQDVRSKTLLTNGFDQLANAFKQAQLRWNIIQQLSFNLDYKDGRKSSYSQFFSSRDYSIKYYEAEPRINYQPNTAFRTSISFKYTDKKNNIFTNMDTLSTTRGGETALLEDYGIEMKYNVLDKGSLNMKFNFVKIKFDGVENSSIGFEMLDGLRTGKNYIWGISYQRTLSNNLQLSLTYDGRKSSSNKAIHTGGAQIRAYF